tara:strand:- start:157 stop:807 length:651 start_codon:yes stop_codon:yes gene_type:complete
MAIQITNDPLNQFLDNLPRYALELRRQDAQRDQFNRQQSLREQAARNQQTLFDLTRDRQKYQSEVFRNMLDTQVDYRNAKSKWDNYVKNNQSLLDQFEDRQKAFFGVGAPKTFENFLERKSAFNKRLGITENVVKTDKALAELKSLPDLSAIKPKELLPPKNVELNPSLYSFATQQILPTRDQDIQNLYSIFGGTRMGYTVPSEFTMQNIVSRSTR